MEGWRLGKQQRYRPIKANKRGWLWLESPQLYLGTWEGSYLGIQATWLRFYDRDGKLIPIRAEAAEAEVTKLQARLAELEKKGKNNR